MRAELLKLRALPTPRWTLAGCLATVGLGLLVGLVAGVGKENVIISAAAELPTQIAGIVLGAWIVGLEYGQLTMRRTLTADPRRVRLLAAKVAVAMLMTILVTAAAFLLAVAAYPTVTGDAASAYGAGEVAVAGLAILPGNLVYCVIGASIALLTRSMAGGVTAALVFAVVLDTALGAITAIADYTLQSSILDIYDAIKGDGDPELARAVAMTAAWAGILSLAGVTRFVRTDV